MRTQAVTWLAACVLGLTAVSAQAAGIVDRAAFFSPEAVVAANRKIADLERKYHHQIHLETYAELPADQQAGFAGLSKSEKDAVFVSWIKQRAKATNASGLFLLACKDPAHLHSGMGESLSRHGLTSQARQRIVDAMLKSFRDKRYDEGLTGALTQIETEFSQLSTPGRRGNLAPVAGAKGQNHGGNMSGIVIIGLIIVGGLILLSVLGRAFGGGQAGAPGMMGGGFGSGLMGGLLGAVAGNWLYNSFSGHHGQAFGGDDHSGGSFGGGSSGGDDFGGGADFGGGDFGGGDSGGGGDF